jgi:hypothetical protein
MNPMSSRVVGIEFTKVFSSEADTGSRQENTSLKDEPWFSTKA